MDAVQQVRQVDVVKVVSPVLPRSRSPRGPRLGAGPAAAALCVIAVGVGVGGSGCGGCGPSTGLVEVTGFGSNPGALAMYALPPAGDPTVPRPLVVALHGCLERHTFAADVGMEAIAAERGFALIAPEQQRSNNFQRCFNWFEPVDASGDGGEAASILQMVEHVATQQAIDRSRVFVFGMSAGAGMTNALLAAHPETFQAGASFAGVPSGCAESAGDGVDCMAGRDLPSVGLLSDRVRGRRRIDPGGAERSWPRLLVVQGARDRVVRAANSDALMGQWTELHGLDEATATQQELRTREGVATVRDLADGSGRSIVRRVLIDDFGHAFPVAPADGCGTTGPFLQDFGWCGAAAAADFFEL